MAETNLITADILAVSITPVTSCRPASGRRASFAYHPVATGSVSSHEPGPFGVPVVKPGAAHCPERCCTGCLPNPVHRRGWSLTHEPVET